MKDVALGYFDALVGQAKKEGVKQILSREQVANFLDELTATRELTLGDVWDREGIADPASPLYPDDFGYSMGVRNRVVASADDRQIALLNEATTALNVARGDEPKSHEDYRPELHDKEPFAEFSLKYSDLLEFRGVDLYQIYQMVKTFPE